MIDEHTTDVHQTFTQTCFIPLIIPIIAHGNTAVRAEERGLTLISLG